MIFIKPKQKPFYAMFSLGRILLTAPYSIQACQSFHFLFSNGEIILRWVLIIPTVRFLNLFRGQNVN